jgi:hypothetical protein
VIIVCSRDDEANLYAAESFGIDALMVMDQRETDYLVIEVHDDGIDIVATDLAEAARLLLHMLTNGIPPTSIHPPPLEVSQIAWQSRH